MTYRDDVNRPETATGPEALGPVGRQGVSIDEAERIGEVVSVSGSRVVARIDVPKSGMRSGPDVMQISALVKMSTAQTMVFGMVKGLSVPDFTEADGDGNVRIMELELVGEGIPGPDGGPMVFRRGVSFCPTLGDGVYAASQDDLMRVYAQPNVSSAKVGTIYQDQTLPAFVSVDDLLGKHFAVLGTTGCGKSCAVATMLRAILSQHTEGHVLLLDLHNEYNHAFSDFAELLTADRLKLPYWLLTCEELQEIVVEKSDDQEIDKSILKDAIVQAKRVFNEGDERVYLLGADTPVPYRMSELLRYLDASLGKLDKPTDSAPYLRLLNRLNVLLADRRFEFMFEERFTVADSMADILGQLFRVPANGKPLTILDLSEVPSDVMKVVISVLCRLTFDFAFWANRETPVLLVCEEAHRYANQLDEESGYRLIKRALSRIVNEGRKHGVSLGIVSQRPSELDMGILSQCNTIFAMRMSNLRDQEFVRGTLSESALGLTDALPSLRTGEAIAVGEAVAVPVRLYFDFLDENQRPLSATAEFSKSWKTDEGLDGYVPTIVDRWRRQRR